MWQTNNNERVSFVQINCRMLLIERILTNWWCGRDVINEPFTAYFVTESVYWLESGFVQKKERILLVTVALISGGLLVCTLFEGWMPLIWHCVGLCRWLWSKVTQHFKLCPGRDSRLRAFSFTNEETPKNILNNLFKFKMKSPTMLFTENFTCMRMYLYLIFNIYVRMFSSYIIFNW